jgi:hypothetical protein
MDIFKILGSKWFTLLLGIGMAFLLPYTWHNVQVVFEFGQASKFWYLIAVFICNILAVGFCAYKSMSMLTKKPQASREEW